jgi:NDP-sugar pyrophosphorylase family protein
MRKIRVAVIPAAGKGSRISALSDLLPKPMIPVIDRPVLDYIIRKLVGVGVKHVYLIVNWKKEKIKEFFGNGSKYGIKIKYVEQRNPKGIGHAIGLTEKYIKEPFFVVLGDDFTITDSLQGFVDKFFEKKAIVVQGNVMEYDEEVIKRTGCVTTGKDGKYIRVLEKPEKPFSNIRICGIYVFHPKIFNYIKESPRTPPRNEIEITTAIERATREGKVYGHFIDGINININTKEELLLANILLAKKLESKNQMNLGKLKWYLKHAHPK